MTTDTLTSTRSQHEIHWAMGVHLGAMILAFLTSWLMGFAGMLVAAVVLLLRPINSEFVAEHAKESLNFNLSMFLWAVGGVLFTLFTLGLGLLITIPMAIVFAIVWFVCSIQATLAASKGEAYRYPLTWRIF